MWLAGIQVDEPAADLAIAVAIASSWKDVPCAPALCSSARSALRAN